VGKNPLPASPFAGEKNPLPASPFAGGGVRSLCLVPSPAKGRVRVGFSSDTQQGENYE